MDFKIPIFAILGIFLVLGISNIGLADAHQFSSHSCNTGDILSADGSTKCMAVIAPNAITKQCNSVGGFSTTYSNTVQSNGQPSDFMNGIGNLKGIIWFDFDIFNPPTAKGTAWLPFTPSVKSIHGGVYIDKNNDGIRDCELSLGLGCALGPQIPGNGNMFIPLGDWIVRWIGSSTYQHFTNFPLGPSSTASDEDDQDLKIIDTSSPSIALSNPVMTVKTNTINGISKDQINFGTSSYSDTCSLNGVITNDAPNHFPLGMTEVKYTTTDPSGNMGTKTQMVMVEFEDTDGDGITDDIDTLPNDPSSDFADTTNNPTTEGTITTQGDQVLTIGQEPVPDGVLFNADNVRVGAPAQIIACDNLSQLSVDSGDSGTITCGSVTVEVISGSVDVQFNTENGPATTTMGATDSLSFDGTLKFTNNSLTNPAVITIRGSTFTLDPGETLTITFPTSKTSYQDPNLGDVRYGEGHDNGFCMNQNCINVDGFFNHFPETIVPQGSTQTFSLLINCPRGTNTCNHASIEGVLPDSDFYEEQWGVSVDRQPRSDTWETTINNPYGEIGDVTTTVQEVGQSFLSVSFNIEFLIPGSIGTADGLRVAHENNRFLHVTVWDSNRGISNYIFNEGVYVDDIYAYPKVETSYETPLEIEKLCLDSNTNKRYTCAFDKVREWTIKNAEKALLEIKGITELDVLNEEFLSKFKELKQAIADEDSEKISELQAQLDELGIKIHNQKQ